jgi:ankyrin repeat protein
MSLVVTFVILIFQIAQLLIERKCDVNAIGGVLASTPLHWAARHGHARMIALLVRNGANYEIRDVEGITNGFL